MSNSNRNLLYEPIKQTFVEFSNFRNVSFLVLIICAVLALGSQFIITEDLMASKIKYSSIIVGFIVSIIYVILPLTRKVDSINEQISLLSDKESALFVKAAMRNKISMNRVKAEHLIERAKELNFISPELQRTSLEYEQAIKNCLEKNGTVRLIKMKHDSEAVGIHSKGHYGDHDFRRINSSLNNSTNKIRDINRSTNNGLIELREINFVFPYSIFIIEDDSDSYAIVILNAFKISGDNSIQMVISRKKNEEEYAFFKEQFNLFWKDSQRVVIE